jgi:hypothetical protein
LPGRFLLALPGVVVMVSSMVSPAGQRRTTSHDGTRIDARPGRNASRRGHPRPSLHGPRRADKFTGAL